MILMSFYEMMADMFWIAFSQMHTSLFRCHKASAQLYRLFHHHLGREIKGTISVTWHSAIKVYSPRRDSKPNPQFKNNLNTNANLKVQTGGLKFDLTEHVHDFCQN